MLREWLRNWLGITPAPAIVIDAATNGVASPEWSLAEMVELAAAEKLAQDADLVGTWQLGEVAPGVLEQLPEGGVLALDWQGADPTISGVYQWAGRSAMKEGLGFLGFPYLSELSQRPEYRRAVEIIAGECTRRWIKLTGAEDEKLNDLADLLDNKFRLRHVFRMALEKDGFFGRVHIYPDIGFTGNDDEQQKPLLIDKAKIGKEKLTRFKIVEPYWSYPLMYNSTDPLADDFYVPQQWSVMSKVIHASRLVTIVTREVPDMLKPAYQFGGLALTQMGKPYVDNWLRTRQAVSDIVRNFSIINLATTLAAQMGNKARELIKRAKAFVLSRDNQGLMVTDKETEELKAVNVPLSSLDKLQAQAQEHMAAVWGIPLIIYLGITPSGLNATADPEIRAFFTHIGQIQERFRDQLLRCIQLVQLSEWGEIDDDIGFDFIPLWEMDETEKATIRKSDADAASTYVTMGAVSNEEVREMLANEEGGMFEGIDLAGKAPDPPAIELANVNAQNDLAAQKAAAKAKPKPKAKPA